MTKSEKTENEIKEIVETQENHDDFKTTYDTLKATVEALNLDYEKFNEKRVKVAGARVRNNLLNCRKLCDKLRKHVLADIRAIPTKHRKECEDELIEIPKSLEQLDLEELESDKELIEIPKQLEPLEGVKIKKARKSRKTKTN